MKHDMHAFIVWRNENVKSPELKSPEYGWVQAELDRLGIPRMMTPKEMMIRWKAAHTALVWDAHPTAYRLQILRNNGTDIPGHA